MTQETFVSLLKPLQQRLFRTAYRMLLDEEDAKDTVQDVLIKLWNKRSELEKCKSVEAWCLTVTKNTALDKIKHRKYRVTQEFGSASETTTNAQASELHLELKNVASIARQCIDQLPEKQKLLIHFRDIEGLSYEMIAEIMGMSNGEVKIGLFRARKLIREKISKIVSYGTE